MTPPESSDLPPALFDHAMEQIVAAEGASRREACDALVAAHPRHAAALRRLLAQAEAAERVLDRTFPAPTDADPEAIGDYRVVRRLGEGAFGIVFLCQQERPIARRVAIKVLRPGAGD